MPGRTLMWGGLAAATLSSALVAAALVAPSAAAEGSPVPPSPAPAVLAPIDVVGSAVPAPTTAGLTAALGPLIGPSLGQSSVVVIDPTTSTVLFDSSAHTPRIPASTLKLATSAAALNILGPQTRIATTVYRKGKTLYLVGGGDPTLVRSSGGNPLAGGASSLRELAKASASQLTSGPNFTIIYDDSAFTGPTMGPGWPASFPSAGVVAPVTALMVDQGRVRPGANSRVNDPSKQAAQVFVTYLKELGLSVKALRKGTKDAAATELAKVESPPVGDIVQRMLTESENNFAEALAHLTGGKLLGNPSFVGGAAAVSKTLTELGIESTGATIADGSGLSRQNQVPAVLLADVLSDAARAADPDLASIPPGLAIAGLTGTLADRFHTPQTLAGRGVVHAKTGTLTGVISLAGIVQDRDGRVLVFTVMSNKVSSLNKARETMDRIASQLATCGCR